MLQTFRTKSPYLLFLVLFLSSSLKAEQSVTIGDLKMSYPAEWHQLNASPLIIGPERALEFGASGKLGVRDGMMIQFLKEEQSFWRRNPITESAWTHKRLSLPKILKKFAKLNRRTNPGFTELPFTREEFSIGEHAAISTQWRTEREQGLLVLIDMGSPVVSIIFVCPVEKFPESKPLFSSILKSAEQVKAGTRTE